MEAGEKAKDADTEPIQNPVSNAFDGTATNTSSSERRCPRGHTLIKRMDDLIGTCDVCDCRLQDGQAVLYCKPCDGFCVCSQCTDKSDQPTRTTISTDLFDKGIKLFKEQEYEEAADLLRKCLDSREDLQTRKPAECYHVAQSAGALAKAMLMGGNKDAALEVCQSTADLCRDFLSEADPDLKQYWENEVDYMLQLLADIQTLSRNDVSRVSDIPPHPKSILGVSVYHLKTVLMAHARLCFVESPTIHQLENLSGPPGVIRREGARLLCPIDGRMGAAYVHCLFGQEHVGEATHMLSYSWSYCIGDIVGTLSDYCQTHHFNPKRTYIWIDCLCINQHRVVEQKQAGGTGLLNFEEEFPKTLRGIGHMLAMMAPWKDPFYLTRIWCIFELHVAHENGCTVDIVMPPTEKKSLALELISEGQGIDHLYEVFRNIMVQKAQASFEKDRQKILTMIEESVGFSVLNDRVNKLLCSWVQRTSMQLLDEWDSEWEMGNNKTVVLVNIPWIGSLSRH